MKDSRVVQEKMKAAAAAKRIGRRLNDAVHRYDGDDPHHRMEVTGHWPGDYAPEGNDEES